MRNQFKIAWFAALTALASPAAAANDPLIVQVPQISSAAAQQLGEACVAFAAKANTATAVAVVDPAGHLLYFFARQGASASAPKTAELKAVTAARWGRSTSQLMDLVKTGNAEYVWFGDFPQPGGLPIIQDGHTLGAVGVAGPGDCLLSTARSARGCHPCLRYVPSTMSPGRTQDSPETFSRTSGQDAEVRLPTSAQPLRPHGNGRARLAHYSVSKADLEPSRIYASGACVQ
jgi:glc operon protein GlcG